MAISQINEQYPATLTVTWRDRMASTMESASEDSIIGK
jgi:hypothetical protein